MRKFRIFWDFEQEEAYLDDMAAHGHIFQKYTMWGFYHFCEGAPQHLNYKIDYKTFRSRGDYEDYLALFEDAGWAHICGTKNSCNHYFLPKDPAAGSTEIFSTRESAASRYKQLYELCMMFFAIFMVELVSIYLSNGGFAGFGFLTPGLWQRTGLHFWAGFFFELPFVILRCGSPLILAAIAGLYGYWGSRAKKAYDTMIKEDTL